MSLPRVIDDKRSWLVAAVALALLLSTGVLGMHLASSGRSPTPEALHTPTHGAANPALPIPAAGAPAAPVAPAASIAPVAKRLHNRGYAATERQARDDTDCVSNSFGETQNFLRQHRCVSLRRSLVEVKTSSGTALLALAWVRMADEAGATALKAVLDRGGTGNISALDQASSFSGNYYASVRDGAVTLNAEARPLTSTVDPSDLRMIAATAAGAW